MHAVCAVHKEKTCGTNTPLIYVFDRRPDGLIEQHGLVFIMDINIRSFYFTQITIWLLTYIVNMFTIVFDIVFTE